MKQTIDLDQLEGLKKDILSSNAHLESLEALQEAYEQWKMEHGGVGVMDLFWSWKVQA